MNNTKTTKRALLSSVMAMFICVAMLIGTTFAWFTDSASTAVNKIQAGTLKIELQYQKADGSWEDAEGKTLSWKKAATAPADEQVLWEPGCKYELPALKITNKGNLALQFKVLINSISGDKKLLDAIDFTVEYFSEGPDSERLSVDINKNTSIPVELPNPMTSDPYYEDYIRELGWTGIPLGTAEYVANNFGTDYMCVKLSAHMKEDAGIEYQGMTLNDFAITVVSTQVAGYEYDSFNNTYDKNATYEIPVDPNAQTVDFTNYATDTEFVLNNYTDLKAFANELNVNGKSFSGKTVKLGANIDLGNTEWTPIGQTGGNGTTTWFQGTFDGDYHTIKNLAISASAWDEGANYAAGLFGFIDADGATIKNLTIDGAKVEGHHWTGAVVGYLTGTVENCHVKNATITSTHANDDACGDKVGAVVGYINTGDSVVSGCTAYKCTIKAGRDAGQIVGCNTVNASVTDCSAEEVTVEATGDCTGNNIKNEIVGRTS